MFSLLRSLTLVKVLKTRTLSLSNPCQLHLRILKYRASRSNLRLISSASEASMHRIPQTSAVIHILIDVVFRTSILAVTTVLLNTNIGILLVKIEQILQSVK